MESPNPKAKDKMILWAREILEHKGQYVILDTETTGLNKNDVIIQIAIIDLDGNILINSLVKPTKRKRISAEASAIHGITMKALANAPTFAELKPEIDRITTGKTVLIYNAEYDLRLIEQTTSQDACLTPHFKAGCVMTTYSWFVQEWSDYYHDYRYQRLPKGDHSAAGDCRATLKVLHKMAQAELSMPPVISSPVTDSLAITPQINAPQAIVETKTRKWWQFWK